MTKVTEFMNVNELNNYLREHIIIHHFEIVPVAKMFEHPTSKLIVSCITYVLIEE